MSEDRLMAEGMVSRLRAEAQELRLRAQARRATLRAHISAVVDWDRLDPKGIVIAATEFSALVEAERKIQARVAEICDENGIK